jgi:hypothetical protein
VYAQDVEDLLPADNEIPGWVKDGPPQTAETPDELFGLIDGAAPVYIENGFVECIFQDYMGDIMGTPTTLQARVFDQGNAENASSLYDALGTGLETDWDGAGSEARINYLLPFNFTLEFWRNRFYVHLNINREADSLTALQTIQAFAIAMDEVAVPVELTSFRGFRTGSSVVLTWSTASENRCFGFRILRSEQEIAHNAVNISAIIPGHGTTSDMNHYRYTDEDPPDSDILFYWLEDISLTGESRVYGPVIVSGTGDIHSWGDMKASFGN